MVKLERISLGGIENLAIDTRLIECIGKGLLSYNFIGELEIDASNLSIIDRGVRYNYENLDERDCFLINAENFLKENKLYIVNANFKKSIFSRPEINGKFYQEISEYSKKGIA